MKRFKWFPPLFRLAFVACPFVLNSMRFETSLMYWNWKAVYVFGVRVAVWSAT